MKIFNNTSQRLIAFAWNTKGWRGKDVEIEPNQSAEIIGPYCGNIGGGGCRIVVEGEVFCQEGPDDDNGFQVIKGKHLNLQRGDNGVSVRHYSENRLVVE